MKKAVQQETLRANAAIRTLEANGYSWRGGEQWAPPIGKAPDFDLIDSLRSKVAGLEAQLSKFLADDERDHSDEDEAIAAGKVQAAVQGRVG